MSTEIIIASAKYGIKALDNCVAEVAKIVKATNEGSLHLCAEISKVATLWESEDTAPKSFANVAAFCKAAFGLEKTEVYDCLKIGRRFVIKDGKRYRTNLVPDESYMDYSRSQLIQLLPFSDEQINSAVSENVINAAMSCRALKQAMRDFTKPADSERSETETTETTETAETPETAETSEKEPAVKYVKIIVQSADSEEVLNELLIPMAAYDDLVRKYPQK